MSPQEDLLSGPAKSKKERLRAGADGFAKRIVAQVLLAAEAPCERKAKTGKASVGKPTNASLSVPAGGSTPLGAPPHHLGLNLAP
jgi:hypothetical protein